VGRPNSVTTGAAAVVQSVVVTPPTMNRIYVGSIFWELTADDIKVVFQAFGPIRSCVLMPNPETGKHKGYGFVEFETPDAAELAIKHMNGAELAGRKIRVGRAVQGMNAMGEPHIVNSNEPPPGLPSLVTPQPGLLGALPVFPGMVTLAGQGAGLSAATLQAAQTAAAIASQLAAGKKLEESLNSEENMFISANQRVMLMQKLARESAAQQVAQSRCVVLRNMVDADEIDAELEEEVTGECSKFGNVEKVVIYQEKVDGAPTVKVFVLFSQSAEAGKAVAALNGRWFGGKVIKADHFDMEKFNKQQYSG